MKVKQIPMSAAFGSLNVLKTKANERISSLSSIELAVLRSESITAAVELAYLQACAAEWEFFSKMQGTDASKVAFMEQTVRKLAKLKEAG